jgi:ribosomal protein S24E
MSLEVLEEKINPVIGRKEARLVIHHQGAGTPDRISVRKLASEHFKAPLDQVFVKSISTRTGGSSALCMVEIYQDAGRAQKAVPSYLKNRNLPKDQRVSKQKKPEEPKPAAPPPVKKAAPEPKPAAKPEPPKEAKPPSEKARKPPEKEPKPSTKPDAKPKA